LKYGGALEKAAAMTNHIYTIQLHDRVDEVTLAEIERVGIC
jgi:hypothetical protein